MNDNETFDEFVERQVHLFDLRDPPGRTVLDGLVRDLCHALTEEHCKAIEQECLRRYLHTKPTILTEAEIKQTLRSWTGRRIDE